MVKIKKIIKEGEVYFELFSDKPLKKIKGYDCRCGYNGNPCRYCNDMARVETLKHQKLIKKRRLKND